MNIKRLAIGSVVGTIALYLVGMLIWQILLVDFFAANSGSATGVERENSIMWAIVLGNLFYAVLLTLALESRGASKSVVDGLVVGMVVGALLWGTADFILYGITNLNTLTGAVADTVLEGIHGGIAGAVIAGVLGKLGD